MTFRVIDGDTLSDGEWETVVPFVVYQSSDKPFSSSESGGAYVTNGGSHTGGSEPTKIIEWNRVELRISQ